MLNGNSVFQKSANCVSHFTLHMLAGEIDFDVLAHSHCNQPRFLKSYSVPRVRNISDSVDNSHDGRISRVRAHDAAAAIKYIGTVRSHKPQGFKRCLTHVSVEDRVDRFDYIGAHIEEVALILARD